MLYGPTATPTWPSPQIDSRNVLKDLGVGRGDRVFALAGRIPELYVAALGTWKTGGVFCPLFSAFGPDPIRPRMSIGTASVLVTTEAFYRKKVMPWRSQMSHLRHVLLAQRDSASMPPDTIDLGAALAAARPDFDIAATQPGDPALLHFTSGTTGRPKGAIHVHEAVVAHHITGKYALDLHPDDVFWCTADPGWVTGTSYGIIAPLTNGVTMIVDEAEFDAERWYRILQDERVTVWYTAPTAIRMLMKIGAEPCGTTTCRACASWPASASRSTRGGGVEPGDLRPAVPRQLVADRDRRHHDRQFRGNGHQAGVDGAPAAGHRGGDRRAPTRRRDRRRRRPMTAGELALRPGWPSMFRGYLDEEERYREVLCRRLVS